MIIRPAKKQDADTIAHLWLQLVAYHRELDANMPVASRDGVHRYAQRIRYAIDDGYLQVYVAEEQDEIIGYVYGTIIDLLPETFASERAGMVADIFVKESCRGRGVGKALMHMMRDWFSRHNIKHYEWYVAAANTEGIRFWKEVMGGVPVMIRMRANVSDE